MIIKSEVKIHAKLHFCTNNFFELSKISTTDTKILIHSSLYNWKNFKTIQSRIASSRRSRIWKRSSVMTSSSQYIASGGFFFSLKVWSRDFQPFGWVMDLRYIFQIKINFHVHTRKNGAINTKSFNLIGSSSLLWMTEKSKNRITYTDFIYSHL